jgi:acyl-coenzyme A thioesterase PaaI-like protein
MPLLELPHTAGCVVCGPRNPHGLHLHLFVDAATGIVQVDFTPLAEHIGFEGIIHGGILATVIDEAMVWAATWAGKRFCVCGEMSVRFRRSATVGQKIVVTAKIESQRPKLIQTTAEVTGSDGVLAVASGKYIPLAPDRHAAFVDTLIDEPATAESANLLRDTSK